MKKFKSFVYVLALALIFVGAASVTKASAEDAGATGNTVTWQVPEKGVTSVTVTSGGNSTAVTSGETLVVKETVVTVAYVAAEGYTVTVESSDATLTKTPDADEYTFAMPDKAVTLTIKADAVEQGGNDQNTPTQAPAAEKITKDAVDVWYDEEIISVESEAQVYYQIVKSETDTSKIKTANWIKAAEAGDGEYWIDFSATANSKDVFFALATDSTKTGVDYVVTVDAAVKSMKAVLNYKTEEFDGGLADVISTLDIKGVDADYTTKEGFAANDADHAKKLLTAEATKDAKVFSLQWKRGVNGEWQGATAFDPVDWNMLKASNGTLYIAADGLYKLADGEAEATEFRMSKEAKVKIPKSAKAPTIKVDYIKGTLAVKNGMQIRLDNNGVWTDWMDVIAYDKNAQNNGIFALAEKNLKTNAKASKVVVADFVAAINDEAILNFGAADGATLKLEVRTGATEKKFPSMTGIMELVLPAAKPTVAEEEVALTYTAKVDKTPAEYKVKFSDLFTKAKDYTAYEYVLVGDKTKGVNLEKQKWTKLTGEEVDWSKNVGKNYTYYEAGSTEKKTVAYEKIDAIYIRLAAEKAASKDTVGVFASNYAVIDVKVEEKKPETTPTPTPGEEPTGTPDATEYTVTFSVVDGAAVGTLKVAGTDATLTEGAVKAKEGDTVTFTYTAKDATATVVVSDGTNTIEAAEGVYTVTVAKANVTITITETPADQGNP